MPKYYHSSPIYPKYDHVNILKFLKWILFFFHPKTSKSSMYFPSTAIYSTSQFGLATFKAQQPHVVGDTHIKAVSSGNYTKYLTNVNYLCVTATCKKILYVSLFWDEESETD